MVPSRKPPQSPPTFIATPESLISDAKKLNDMFLREIDRITEVVKPETATFKNTVLQIAQAQNKYSLSSRIIKFYRSVSTDKRLRDASTEAEKMIKRFLVEMYMREDIFQLVEAVFQKSTELDPESQRLLEKTWKRYIRKGALMLHGQEKDRFKKIQERLSQITVDFQRTLNEGNEMLWVTKEEIEGVPEDAINNLEKGTGEHEGKIRISLKAETDVFLILKFALSPELRRKLYIECQNKCNSNATLFREAIVLRDESARLLGYPNYASLKIEGRIAKTPKVVFDFLGDLRTQLTPAIRKEIEHLKDLKIKDLKSRGLEQSYDGNLYLWDYLFYCRLMDKNEDSIDELKVAEYFPLPSTVKGILKTFEGLFGLVFVLIEGVERDQISETSNGAHIVWHEDVMLFSVWNDEKERDEFCGYLYLDLHPRDGKRSGAVHFNLQPGFTYLDGTRRYPVAALLFNFSKPTLKKPSLLKHREVKTLFHELGHGIHDLVAKTIYSCFHGTSVARDFAEVPSKMLEKWCWIPSQIKSLSTHYETGEQLTDYLIGKLVKTQGVKSMSNIFYGLYFSIFDMVVHTPETHEDAEKMNISELYNVLLTEISGLKGPEALGMPRDWGHGYATYGYLMRNYGAGYYSYPFSEFCSADMYTKFEQGPMNREMGRLYRYMVLEKGGSRDEMMMIENFLGRELRADAFYRQLGLQDTLTAKATNSSS